MKRGIKEQTRGAADWELIEDYGNSFPESGQSVRTRSRTIEPPSIGDPTKDRFTDKRVNSELTIKVNLGLTITYNLGSI